MHVLSTNAGPAAAATAADADSSTDAGPARAKHELVDVANQQAEDANAPKKRRVEAVEADAHGMFHSCTCFRRVYVLTVSFRMFDTQGVRHSYHDMA